MMKVWGWPVVMGVLSAAGLFSALWGDGAWDVGGWIGLGIPAAVCLWFGWRGRSASARS